MFTDTFITVYIQSSEVLHRVLLLEGDRFLCNIQFAASDFVSQGQFMKIINKNVRTAILHLD